MAEFAESLGLVLDPWQRLCLEVGLGTRPDGKWAAMQVLLLVPRQNGKGSILEALELAGLFIWNEKLILHSAHEFKTSQEAFRRVLSLVENNDWLRAKCKKPRTSHGEEGIETLDGKRLRFVARSTGSGRGFTGDRVILDEAYALTEGQMAALLPTMSAKSMTGNPQIWYTSSAPLETSTVLHRLRRQGRDGDPSLAFLEWSADDEADSADPEALRIANPALGIRIDDEFVDVERAAMGDPEFRRERLGISPDVLFARVLPADDWSAVSSPDAAPAGGVVFAVDAQPERTSASIVACDEYARIEVIDCREGLGWVSSRVAELAKSHDATIGVDSQSPAHSFADEWERQGVTVHRMQSREMAGACGTFYDAVINHQMWVRPSVELDKAAAGARKRYSGDVWYWARKDLSVDVSPLVAASIARWLAVAADGPSVYQDRGMTVLG